MKKKERKYIKERKKNQSANDQSKKLFPLSSKEEKEKTAAPKKEKEEKIWRKIPPKVEWVKQYCDERENGIDAQQFCDYYQARGWMIGKNKIKDWQAAVRTWEGRRREEMPKPPPNPFNVKK